MFDVRGTSNKRGDSAIRNSVEPVENEQTEIVDKEIRGSCR